MSGTDATGAVELIKASFGLLEPVGPRVIERFYERLFAAAPGVRGMFPADMKEQRKHLLSAVALVVKNADRLESLAGPLAEMGRRHVGYGAKAEHYPVVRDTMLATLGEFAGSAWTAAMRSAWEGALNRVAGMMLEGAGVGGARRAA